MVDKDDFKFPSYYAGQNLFIKGDDWQFNAMLGWTHFPWDMYASGYKDAADVLVKAVLERTTTVDSVIYPLVFLYRQGLELQLKIMLPYARKLAGKDPSKDHTHFLKNMWVEFRQLYEEIDSSDSDKDMDAIEGFIMQLHDIDPGSFAFRYPEGTKGEVHLPDIKHINVRHLALIMESVFLALNGMYAYLTEAESY